MMKLKDIRICSKNGFVTIEDINTGILFQSDLRTVYNYFHNQEVFSVEYREYGVWIRANIAENLI